MRPAPDPRLHRQVVALLLGPALAVVLASCSAADPGWTFAPAPVVTPAPTGSPVMSAPAGTADASVPAGSPAASEPAAPADGVTLRVVARNIAFDVDALQAPAGQSFTIEFDNQDAGIPHNVEIRDASGTSVFMGEIFNGIATRSYEVPALAAGTYTFICTVHPNMTGTLTVS